MYELSESNPKGYKESKQKVKGEFTAGLTVEGQGGGFVTIMGGVFVNVNLSVSFNAYLGEWFTFNLASIEHFHFMEAREVAEDFDLAVQQFHLYGQLLVETVQELAVRSAVVQTLATQSEIDATLTDIQNATRTVCGVGNRVKGNTLALEKQVNTAEGNANMLEGNVSLLSQELTSLAASNIQTASLFSLLADEISEASSAPVIDIAALDFHP